MNNLIQKLIPVDDLKETIFRFPLSVLCGVTLFIFGFLFNHDFLDDSDEILGRILTTIGCCYFWFGITQLIADRYKWPFIKQMLWALPVAGAMAFLFISSAIWGMHLIFILPALLLLIMVAPYLTGGDDLSFWFFNRQLWFGVIVSYAALILFAGGLSIALAAIDKLFGVDIDHELYLDIWMFASLVIGPVYALSWVPRRFEFTEEDCHDPPGLKFIVNWISVPMVVMYLLILYAYFIKIVMEGALPSGHLATMISGFVGAGVVTYLVSWPIRDKGSLQLKLFHKIFFPALIIPVGFHFFAIIERVSAYGVTEQRYMLLLSAMWFGFLAIAFTMAKGKAPIKAIPLTLAILFVFASFGPWGGVSVSGLSQYKRLESLLTQNGALKEGKIVKITKANDISFEDRLSISSILDYLCHSERDYMIKDWFLPLEEKENWNCYAYNLTEKIGFQYVYKYRGSGDDEYFNVYTYQAKNHVLEIQGYKHIGIEINLNARSIEEEKFWDRAHKLEFQEDDVLQFGLDKKSNLIIRRNEEIILEHDLTEFVKEHKGIERPETYPLLDVKNEQISARLIITDFGGIIIKDGKTQLNHINFNIAFTLKE